MAMAVSSRRCAAGAAAAADPPSTPREAGGATRPAGVPVRRNRVKRRLRGVIPPLTQDDPPAGMGVSQRSYQSGVILLWLAMVGVVLAVFALLASLVRGPQ